jgi:hypothetical protein
MAQTPEGRVKDKIKRILKERHAYWYMPVSNGMGAPALDFIVCFRGYFLSIEAKAPGKRPTARQVQTMNKIKMADGHAIVVDGSHESYAEMIDWLNLYDDSYDG